MRIVVAVKRVVDANVKIHVKFDGSDVDLAHVRMAINPFDEIAIEEAVRIKEVGRASEVVVVSMGTNKCQEQLRAALALGADRAILVETNAELGPRAVASLLRAVVERERPQLVILGKQAIDDDANQTGQMLGTLLNWPLACCASRVKLDDAVVTVTCEVDGGLETLALALPAVITADLRLNEPRYSSLSNIIKAKKVPIETLTPADLGVDLASRHKTLKIEASPVRRMGIKVASVAELVGRLRNEAKVIP